MKTPRPTLLLFMAIAVLLSQTSCAYYERYGMAKSRLQKINPEGLSIYVVDAAHPLTKGWYLSEPKFDKDGVSGFLSRMAEVEILEVSTLHDRHDAKRSRNDVLLYAKPQFALSLPDTATMTIQNSQLEKVEVCELNHMRSIGAPLLGCTGLIILGYLISSESDY